MLNLDTTEGRIVSAALRLAAEKPWSEVSVREIAEAAGTDLVGLRDAFDGKAAIVAAFVKSIDDEVLANAPKPDPAQSPRDALFEVIMARFDALQPHKSALRSIAKDGMLDPALVRAGLNSQAWMLQAAGIDADGIDGGVRVAGLAGVYASVFQTWLDDDDPGMARTMAVLDRRLRRAERTMSTLNSISTGARDFLNMLRPGSRSGGGSRGDDTFSDSSPASGSSQAGTTF